MCQASGYRAGTDVLAEPQTGGFVRLSNHRGGGRLRHGGASIAGPVTPSRNIAGGDLVGLVSIVALETLAAQMGLVPAVERLRWITDTAEAQLLHTTTNTH